MIDPPEISTTPRITAAVIRLTIPREAIQSEMGPAIGELMAALGAEGIAPEGAVFSHHLRMDPKRFDFEVGIPVGVPVTPTGRVRMGELPAARVARTTYRGSYEGLGAAWGEFGSWLTANGHSPAADLWESYRVGPESSPDPSQWQTELVRPLLG